MIANAAATPDTVLRHGRLLDWYENRFILEHPTVFVREPAGGIPHVVVGFPGNLSPYQGLNDQGMSFASNEVDPHHPRRHGTAGRSHVQLMAQLLARAGSLEEARALVAAETHISTELIGAADGPHQQAAIFELSPEGQSLRLLTDGLLFATNHFVGEETADLDLEPAADSSLRRFDRLAQLLQPVGSASRYGALDDAGVVAVLRDRINPWTHEESPLSAFDDNLTLATNGALYAILFVPERRELYVATGGLPVPSQTFVGFSLPALLRTRSAAQSLIAPIP